MGSLIAYWRAAVGAAAVMALLAWPISSTAEVVTFEDVNLSNGFFAVPFAASSGGLSFSNDFFFGFYGPHNQIDFPTLPPSQVMASSLFPGSGLDIRSATGQPFNLKSLQAALGPFPHEGADGTFTDRTTVTAYFADNTVATQTLDIGLPFQTYNLDLSNVTRVNVSPFEAGSGYLGLDNISYSLVGPGPPDVATLAALSADAYSHSSSIINGFTPFDHRDSGDGLVVDIYANSDHSQFVEAIRGTEPDPLLNGSKNGVLENLAADVGVVGGVLANQFEQYASEAGAILSNLESTIADQFHGAVVTLTGHSLGGAIAQLLGQETGLKAVGFDAPGVAQLENNPAGPSGENVNYRLYGDPVSFLGSQVGSVVTVGDGEAFPTGNNVGATWEANSEAHSISNLAYLLADPDTPQTAGIVGPNALPLLLKTALAASVSPEADSIILTFALAMVAHEYVTLDPGAFSDFTFLSDDAAPFLEGLILPSFTGIDHYQVRSFADGTFGQFERVDPGAAFGFGADVSGFEFLAFDAQGRQTPMPDGFMFQLSTTTSGTLNSSLVETFAAAPEASAWLYMIVGLGLVRQALRRRRVALVLRSIAARSGVCRQSPARRRASPGPSANVGSAPSRERRPPMSLVF